jgi:hypothetical protein
MSVQPFELQQALQRFTGEFLDGLSEANDAIRASDPQREPAIMQRLLVYFSSALDIVSSPDPVVNLLDMLVFVTLSRQTLEQCWIRELGAESQRLVAAFTNSERRLRLLSNDVISREQQAEVGSLIDCWRSKHPDQVRVEWVRFADFTQLANLAEQDRASAARGLLGSFKSAAQSADQALMLADRVVFLVNRLPFLIRLHLRVGVQETIDDSLSRVADLPSRLDAAWKRRSGPLARHADDALERVLRRVFGYLVLLGLVWSMLFWGGFWLVR